MGNVAEQIHMLGDPELRAPLRERLGEGSLAADEKSPPSPTSEQDGDDLGEKKRVLLFFESPDAQDA